MRGWRRGWRGWGGCGGGEGEETDVIGSELLVVKQLHKHVLSVNHDDSQQQTYRTV